jgi:dynein heavy chain 1, cytosolic
VDEDEKKASGAVPQWMRLLNQSALQWLSVLPEKLTTLTRTADSIKDPMFRYFEREINVAARLLKQVGGKVGGSERQRDKEKEREGLL